MCKKLRVFLLFRFHQYTSHGTSIQKTKVFLERENRRQTEAVKASGSQESEKGGAGAAREKRKNLQQVGCGFLL